MQEGMEVSISSSPGRVEIEPVDAAPRDLVEFAARFTDRYRAALAELAER
jgi:hypothetical protein